MEAHSPAFPQVAFRTPNDDLATPEMYFDGAGGISVRAYIATKAMAAMIASATHWDGQDDEKEISKWAVKYADALIAELSKP